MDWRWLENIAKMVRPRTIDVIKHDELTPFAKDPTQYMREYAKCYGQSSQGKEVAKRCYLAHRDQRKAKSKEYYEKNKEKILAKLLHKRLSLKQDIGHGIDSSLIKN